MKFLFEVIKGMFIGAGAILPGISSGVLCVIFGIYEKLLDCILNFFKDVKNNFKFLFPIVLGVFLGIILFSRLLQFILLKFPMQTSCVFIGLILGGTTLLINNINKKEKFKIKNLIYIVVALIIGICMVIFEDKIQIKNSVENINYIYLVISGLLMSAGIVIPGVSSTIILTLLGTYTLYLNSLANLYFPVLIPMAIGVIIGSIVFMIIIKYLLKKFYIQTMYIIIGFTLGSILILFPQVNNIEDIIISITSIIFGYFITKISYITN